MGGEQQFVAAELHNTCAMIIAGPRADVGRREAIGIAALHNVPPAVQANDALVLPTALGPTNTAILQPERKIEWIVQFGEAHFWR